MSGPKVMHPDSRKARSLSQKAVRDLQKKKVKAKKERARSDEGERLMWFHRRIFGSGGLEEEAAGNPISRDQARQLILEYIGRSDQAIQELREKRRGRSQVSSKEKNLVTRREGELLEFQNEGVVFPDVFGRSKLEHFRVWTPGNKLKRSTPTVRIRSELSELVSSMAPDGISSSASVATSKRLSSTSDKTKPSPFGGAGATSSTAATSSSSSSTIGTSMDTA